MQIKKTYVWSLLSIIVLMSVMCPLTAQSEKPEKPEIQRVTIDSVTGMTVIEWEPSASPDILGYKVYALDITTEPVTGFLLDSLGNDVFSYSYYYTGETEPYYTVTAFDSIEQSLLSGNYHRPVNLEIEYDSCSAEIRLDWDKYIGWENALSGYKIYYKSYPASGCDCPDDEYITDFTELEAIASDRHTFVHEGIQENRHYEYVVEAIDYFQQTATSNRVKYFTYMPAPPEYLSLDYVTVADERTVELSITADISGEINDFRISRASHPNDAFTPVQTLLDVQESNIHVTDNFATQGQQFYYKIEALNSCFHPVISSNLGNNILATGSAEESVIHLEWSPYLDFPEGVENYSISRSNGYGEKEMIASVTGQTLNFTENIRNSGDQNMEGAVSYVIEAQAKGTNPLGIKGTSSSNEVIVNVETRMYLPNAFTPNDDGRNDFFAPVIDFIPADYKMFIYDRSGKILFQSVDPMIGWDGSINGSGKAREGVYIYHIEYLSFNGIRQIATGNLTLVYP